MIVYTNGLATKLGANLMTRLNNLIAAANTAYADSQVQITLRLVNATMVNYTDTNGNSTALDAITPTRPGFNAAFANIESIRDANGADLVALLRDGGNSSGSGVAWLTTARGTLNGDVNPNPLFMYSVSTGCVVGCDSLFIHELGHNMGNAHDRATAAAQEDGDIAQGEGAFPYSFGHYFCAIGGATALTCNPNVPQASGGCGPANLPSCLNPSPNNIGTIMSYFDPVTLKFSNPNVMCNPGGGGTAGPCGVIESAANSANNALSMNNMRDVLQNVKVEKIQTGPGALQFLASSFTTTETAGMASITVQRVGGSVGAVTVNYATQNGTAVAGADYTATSGTLTWPTGDTANQTFLVPIANDGIVEGTETFNVVLSNAGGAVGVFIGAPATAVVSIFPPEVFPPDCQVPVGWTKPATTPYGWTVATDRSNTGGCSLKSVPMPDSAQPGQANANVAQISTSGNYQAGTVSFRYNVSSEPGFDCLRFLINGVQRAEMGACNGVGGNGGFGASGEVSTWTLVSIAVPAGPYTFTWSYDKDDSVVRGTDAAWIDDVTLPPRVPFDLTVIRTGSGTGTVTGAGINCGGDCLENVPGGTSVTLTASASTGSSFTGWTGSCSGLGSCVVTVNAATTVVANFTLEQFMLDVSRLGTGTGTVTSTPTGIDCGATCTFPFNFSTNVTLTATPAMGSTFAGWSGSGCSGTGNCVVTISAAATVNATFNVNGTVPGAPLIGAATPGNVSASVAFSAPASDGGSPIGSYTLTCTNPDNGGTSFSSTGAAAPLFVTGLTNALPYNCSVKATNAIGTGPASANVSVTPSDSAVYPLLSVVSRKTHSGIDRNLPVAIGLPPGAPVTVEPRSIGGGHLLVFEFDLQIGITGNVTVSPAVGSVSATAIGNEIFVALSGIPDNRRITVNITGINGINSTINATATLGFLVGDVNGNGSVNAGDISAVKAQVGQTITANNFRFDLNAAGGISQADVSMVKARSGVVLP